MQGHRRSVHEASLDAAGALVAETGLGSVTMSAVAERVGIGRATLYRYFHDVDAVLAAWHERLVDRHLQHLADVADQADSDSRLAVVLLTYAELSKQHDGSELASRLHRGEHVAAAQARLRAFLAELVTEAARAGHVRADVPAQELSDYALGALSAAGGAASAAAVRRLVELTLAGMRPPTPALSASS
jgi:AcrR family transcriptional regulator